jgi:transcriptional regulator with XRE-family HTH domain
MMTDADKVGFGNCLAKLVADKHWTEAEFARKASKLFRGTQDFRRCEISLYMRGIQFPDPSRLKAICDTLGVEEKALGQKFAST